MIDLVFCAAAEQEYGAALACYAERNVQAAERFDDDFNQALMTIAANPQRFSRCDDRHHYYLMRYFPYRIIYRQHPDRSVVVVVAVVHTVTELLLAGATMLHPSTLPCRCKSSSTAVDQREES